MALSEDIEDILGQISFIVLHIIRAFCFLRQRDSFFSFKYRQEEVGARIKTGDLVITLAARFYGNFCNLSLR